MQTTEDKILSVIKKIKRNGMQNMFEVIVNAGTADKFLMNFCAYYEGYCLGCDNYNENGFLVDAKGSCSQAGFIAAHAHITSAMSTINRNKFKEDEQCT
jgi:adenine deaminase